MKASQEKEEIDAEVTEPAKIQSGQRWDLLN